MVSSDFDDVFKRSLSENFPDIDKSRGVAVGVSGGPDSMALVHALRAHHEGAVHALIVDHGLRENSAQEAASVWGRLQDIEGIQAHILTREHDGAAARIQERARQARYDLMQGYMKERGLMHLFLGHHRDDQAETFLFRLAKGSGLDGLACMAHRQERGDMILCRPMLDLGKADILAYCAARGIDYVEDPSNESEAFARVRLRGSMDVLAREGFTTQRIVTAAARFARARDALERIALSSYDNCLFSSSSKRIVFKYDLLRDLPEEIVLRVILMTMERLAEGRDYGARLSRVEALCRDLMQAGAFRKRTLGGLSFERDDYCKYKGHGFLKITKL